MAPTATAGEGRHPCTWPRTFWFKPDLGLFLLAAFISTAPGLTCPGLLAPDRRDAGSRRVGSRVHGRSEDRGYVVPQASDVSVAGVARWGSRPMAEQRVMSADHLGLTHYRSRRCYESQPDWQRPNGARSRRAARIFQYVTEKAIRADKINGFLPAHRRPTDDHSLVAGGTQRQGSRRAGRMVIGRSACTLAIARATEAGLGSNGRSGH